MPARDILQLGNPILWEHAIRVEDPTDPKIKTLVQDLDDTLAAFRETHGCGRGIAAPQIGVLSRVIFIRMQPTGFCGPLVNPEIVEADSQQIVLWDDCFSFPDLMVRVARSVRVKVAYTDAQGHPSILEADGDLSELLQHEIDHLNGILAVQRAVSPTAFMTRSEWERQQQR